MPYSSYYPPTFDGRAHWWQEILTNGPAVFSALNYSAPQSEPILTDAKWAVYAYGTLRHPYEDFTKALTAYCNTISNGSASAVLTAPSLPAFPAAPTTSLVFVPGFEARRPKWVDTIKKNPLYTPALGASIGIETPHAPFDPNTYQAVLTGVMSIEAHSVTGKFRKAKDRVQGINLYGRKSGASVWTPLGRFNATPFTANVPLAGGEPETWEFQARAVSKDHEFGLPSDAVIVIVRP